MSRVATLKTSRDKARTELAAVTERLEAVLEERAWTEEEKTELKAAEERFEQIATQYKSAKADEKRREEEDEKRKEKLGDSKIEGEGLSVRVGREPLTYGPESPDNSFYRDLLSLNAPLWQDTPAGQRLLRHRQEMIALEKSNSKEGRAVRAYANEVRRRNVAESRTDVTTATGSMGDFAPPLYWLPQYAEYRTYGRTLIDALAHMTMPETGMVFNLPKITAPTEAVNQTASTTQGTGENTTVSTRTMTSSYETGTLQTIIDNLLVSQQYLDRVGPGIGGDQIVRADQQAQVNRTLNIFAWKKLISTATTGTVTFTGTGATHKWTAALFTQVVHKAKGVIQKTDGTVAYPTHFFADVDLWESIEGAFDKNNRPFVVPQGVAFNPLATGDRADVPEGYTGFRFAGVQAFVDQAAFVAWQTVKTATATEKTWHLGMIGALTLSAYWIESTPVIRVLPQPYAKTLTVLIQEYVYCAYVPKYPKAVQLVRGAGTKGTKLTA